MAERDIIGTGWAYPITASPAGGIQTRSGETKVKESVKIVLGTRPGEREMRPDFGSDLFPFVFSANDAELAGQAAFFARRALDEWEPRIETKEVTTSRDDAKAEAEVRYEIRGTNREDNVVVPFYAGETL